MTLTQLSYVVAVSQHKNFGAAAAACFVTQPTLSMQVQKLEETLGAPLFDRTHQPVRTTPLGELVVAQARVVLAEAAKIPEMVRAETGEIEGPLSIGVIPTLSPYLIPLFIQAFITKHPKIELTLEELQTQQIVDRLRAGSLDVGLLVTPLQQSAIEERPLFYEPFYLYVSSRHPLMQEKRVREKDLSSKDVWLLTEGHCFRDQVINLCGDRKRGTSSHPHLRFESGNLETLRKMVDQSSGYTLLPYLAAEDLQDSAHRKQIKEFHAPVPTREVSLVHSKHLARRAVIDALAEEIRAALPKDLLHLKQGRYHRVDLL